MSENEEMTSTVNEDTTLTSNATVSAELYNDLISYYNKIQEDILFCECEAQVSSHTEGDKSFQPVTEDVSQKDYNKLMDACTASVNYMEELDREIASKYSTEADAYKKDLSRLSDEKHYEFKKHDKEDIRNLSDQITDVLTNQNLMNLLSSFNGVKSAQNPAVSFTKDAKNGRYDELSDTDYNNILVQVELIAKHWKDQSYLSVSEKEIQEMIEDLTQASFTLKKISDIFYLNDLAEDYNQIASRTMGRFTTSLIEADKQMLETNRSLVEDETKE